MSEQQAARAVLVSGLALTAIIVALTVKRGEPFDGRRYRQVWAAGVVTLLLATAADFAPRLVVPLAAAIAIAFAVRTAKQNPGVISSLITGQSRGPGGAAGGGTVNLGPPAPGRASAGPFP